ncbi:Mur ligase domain-containing protein, partial [Clostridium sporogenes]
MDLSLILKSLEYSFIKEDKKEIEKIEYDSRKVKEGDLFVCIEGYATDGHKYAQKAYDNGAKVIVCEKDLEDLSYYKECTIIKVPDSRKALAIMASNYYGNPSKHIKIIGITGTNGKTTSTFMMKAILEKAGYKVGLLGTIANYIGNKKIESHRTTPES